MKSLIIILLLLSKLLSAQTELSYVFFKVEGDSIMVWIDNVGNITNKVNASYYRKTAEDISTGKSSSGKITDYYISGEIAFATSFNAGKLNGGVVSYFKNGQVRYRGYYNNSMRDSLWIFYYKNGTVEKKIQYNNDDARLTEYYSSKGKIYVQNGTGKYKGQFIPGYKIADTYKISGNVIDGQLDGHWKMRGNTYADEFYEKGVFIKGNSNEYNYTENPIISLTGFDLHEYVDYKKFIVLPYNESNYYSANQMLLYKKSNNLSLTFGSDIKESLYKVIAKDSIHAFTLISQFTVNEENKIEQLETVSDNLNIKNAFNELILLSNFESPKPNNVNIACSVYICISCENGFISIPDYQFGKLMELINLYPINR